MVWCWTRAPVWTRSEFARRLLAEGIETRPFFLGMHEQPVFTDMGLFKGEKYPVAERIARQGLYLPSGLTLTEAQLDAGLPGRGENPGISMLDAEQSTHRNIRTRDLTLEAWFPSSWRPIMRARTSGISSAPFSPACQTRWRSSSSTITPPTRPGKSLLRWVTHA